MRFFGSFFPIIACAESVTSIGWEPTPPRMILACSTVPSPAIRRQVATPRTGKSNVPRRRSFQYVARQPFVGGRWISVSSSSGRLLRWRIPSSLYSSAAESSLSPALETSFPSLRGPPLPG